MTQTRAPREIRVRTCIATRERQPDTELLRVVIDPSDPNRLLADPGRRLPGRGAWITPNIDALKLAEQRRAFGRAFRVSGNSLDTGHVRTYLAANAAGPDIVRKTEH
ncbi:MAG: YlxR family protein [Corynebacterium sp.]|uniref:YlxR family protein n=1 Tax=Corynebacterium sp. TaxID=1720 RepID=UPI0026E03D05|nr:YlxR family protein [Corynebacterium sp.]MDO5671155.1 YlxR family protein [Corynebacterium sp.]